MTRDVSLCIIRVERSYENDLFSKDCIGSHFVRNFSTLEQIRGKRQFQEITIEFCIPDISSNVFGIEKLSGSVEMASGGATTSGKTDLISQKDPSIHFIAGNPFVETFQGILHLFKEDELTNIDDAGHRSQTVCILAVPATMTCSDLLSFLAACQDDIKHLNIIRDGSPNQYMALITFRTARTVVEFYKSFDGIPFNSLEPEWCCHLVFVSKVEAVGENWGGTIAPVSHTELPTCPVCLERMDESVDGILTILCNHKFHGACLSKWGDTSCPVCRYVQTPQPSGENHCLECMATESLWICLICGHVGCGRYVQGHAYQHYIDTHHCYSMQLGSNSVWDYVGDNFVHRILQNRADGKLVEGPNPEKLYEVKAKINSIQLEYTYLLTSQLESQRTYYEDTITTLKQEIEKASEEKRRISDSAASLRQEKTAIEKKYQSVLTKFNSIQKQLNEEKQINRAMVENQDVWKEKFLTLENDLHQYKIEKNIELKDLKEQLRDVMFYIEAQQAIQNSEERNDIMEGIVFVPDVTTEEPESTGGNMKKRRSRRRRRT